MIPLNVLPIFTAFGITVAVILLLRPISIRLGLIDSPGGRKTHMGNVPLIGGLAMFLGFGFALLTLDVSLSSYRCLIACGALLVMTGILDDFHELSPRSRLCIQLLVGLLLFFWGKIALYSVGNIIHTGTITLGFFALPVTILAVLGVINAVNMTDGVDGLAGSIGFVELFYLTWLAHSGHLVIDQQILSLILSVLLAFLCFNFPWRQRAGVFMGDSGSMLLGLCLVWFCISLSQAPNNIAPPVVFLWILAVPLWDISSVVIRRIIRGFSPFKPDRGHLHHYLLTKNFSSLQVTLIMTALSGVLGLIGILGARAGIADSILFIAFLGFYTLYLFFRI